MQIGAHAAMVRVAGEPDEGDLFAIDDLADSLAMPWRRIHGIDPDSMGPHEVGRNRVVVQKPFDRKAAAGSSRHEQNDRCVAKHHRQDAVHAVVLGEVAAVFG